MSLRRKIGGIFIGNKTKGEQGENKNQVKLKNKTKQSGVLGIVEGILNKGKKNSNRDEREEDESLGQNETTIQNEIQEPEVDPKLIQEIERQVKLALGSLDDDVGIYREEIDLVTTIMSKLYTTKKRIQDCIEIANYLHFDKERIDSFLANFDKFKKDGFFSKFAIDGNVKLLLALYGQIEGLNHLPNERFELTIEEINAIVDAAKDQNDISTVYYMFMYMKHEEINNEGYSTQGKLVANTALEQLKYLRKRQEIYQCTLEKAWHVFGINVDFNQIDNLPRTFSFSGLVKQLKKDYESNFSGNLMSSEIETNRTTNEERESETLGLNSKISNFIRNKQRPSLRDYSYTVNGIQTSLKFRKSEIDEFETAIKNWAKSNIMMKIRPITVIDIEKVYHFFTEQTGQYKNTLTQMKYRDAVKDNRIVSNVKKHPKITAIIGLVGLGGVVLVINTGENIINNINERKAQGTESTIKMGATTIPGTIEPGFLESLYKEPEEIPENTTAVIYPNGKVELITDNGIKEINSNQAISFGISNDETNNKSYIKMGMTDNNAEIPLRDKNGEIIYNKKDGKAIKLLRSSNVIILPEEEIESGLNLLHVIETKTGNEGYVHHGDIPERTIEVQEYNIGNQNPTCYLIKTKDEVPVRETPSASKSYTENIKNTIGAKDEVMYHLAVEDKENEGFYKLLMFGENDSAYVSKKDVELAYVIQSDGAKKIEKEEEIDIYAEDETYEISEGKFAIGYTTIPNTIEEGFIFPSKTEIPEGSYVVSTSKTTTIMTKEGKKIKLKANNEYENSDKEKLGIKYLRTATICTPDGKGTPFLDENGKEKKDKNGNTLMLPERETVIIPPTVKNGEYYKVMDERGKVGNTKFVTDFELFEYDLTRAKIIVVNSGNCPLLKTAYYSSDYTGNFLTNTQGEQLVLTHKKPYIVEKDEESGFWKIIDKQFTREYYIPSEYISEIITITEDGIVEEKQEKEEKGEEPEI